MDQLTLRAVTGREVGSRSSRRLRREGRVPAVVYGREVDETTAVDVDARELGAALGTEAGLNALITLDVEGKEILTVPREVQRHPVRGEITHLDFVNISLTETIQADVAIEIVGIPYGVSQDGGIMETVRNTVLVEALPSDIPSSIELDVSALLIGDSLKIADLADAAAGVTILDDAEFAVVTVQAPRIVEEEVPEELEELEGEEIEGEEGEAAPDAEAEAADEA
jgi:large subunit ribosomal protein L25